MRTLFDHPEEEVSVRYPSNPCSLLLLAAAFAAPSLRAQWVSFQDETATRVNAPAGLVENDQQEKDYAWGDLDQDGDVDLIIARKSPFTSGGHFPNVLLMNEGGVLTDRSGTLTTSIVPGSTAFLDSTNDRDVVIADVNGDGWDDVITCTTLTAGMPQYIRVPRVYSEFTSRKLLVLEYLEGLPVTDVAALRTGGVDVLALRSNGHVLLVADRQIRHVVVERIPGRGARLRTLLYRPRRGDRREAPGGTARRRGRL